MGIAIKRYHAETIIVAEVMDEFIKMSKGITQIENDAKAFVLKTFWCVLCTAEDTSETTMELMEKDRLCEFAVVLTEQARSNTFVDLTIK